MTRTAIKLAMIGIAVLALAGGLAAMSLTSASAQDEEEYTVDVGDFWFGDSSFQGGTYETTIEAGETVTWDFSSSSAPHTTTSDSGLWDSGTLNGGTFDFTFDTPGTYEYHCNIHPSLMKGTIIVEAAGEEPTQPATGETPSETATPAVNGAPNAGQGPSGGSGPSMWWFATGILGLVGTVFVGAAAVANRRAR